MIFMHHSTARAQLAAADHNQAGLPSAPQSTLTRPWGGCLEDQGAQYAKYMEWLRGDFNPTRGNKTHSPSLDMPSQAGSS